LNLSFFHHIYTCNNFKQFKKMGILINGQVGWRSATVVGSSSVDDAQAFILAAGITDPTQQSAITTLVSQLKTYGIWSKMKAIYPFVGGTASQHKFNLKDPRDLDAAYRLVFNGGWTHSSTGALPNGTTGYADTKFTPSASWSPTSVHSSYYSRSNISLSSTQIMFDSFISALNCYQSYISSGIFHSDIFNVTSGRVSGAIPSSFGMFIGNRNSDSSNKIYRNNTIIASNALSGGVSLPNIPLFMAAANTTTGAVGFSSLETAFASIGDGLTDTEAANFYTAVQAYQTTLGRQI